METNQQQFADRDKENDDLVDIPENLRPPMESEIIAQQPQQPQPVSQSGGNSNAELAKGESAEGQNQKGEDGPLPAIPENMRAPLQSGGSSTVEPRSDKSTEKMKQPAEDQNIEEEKGQPEVEEAAVAGKRKRREWSEAAVIALLDAYQQQSEQDMIDDWEEIANSVNASSSPDSDNPRTSNDCSLKFDRLQKQWSQEARTDPTIATKTLKKWYLEKKKRTRSEWDIDSIDALLDAHWDILLEKEETWSGSTAPLFQDTDYERIAEAVELQAGVIKTGKQCESKIGNLTYQYREGTRKWPYVEKVKQLVDAKTAGGSTSNEGAPQSAGPRIAHR